MRLRIHLLAILLLIAALPAARAADDLLAFRDAQGAAARTPGGRGGKIVRVTTLAPSGPGSLLAALETDGPRIVVFEVGGVIDFAQREIKITKPYLTVAGQTAPSPGVTLIRTGIDVTTHDVVLQHIRVRTGSADAPKRGGFEPDAFSTQGAHDVIVDHCSLTWGIDENLSASGPRFTGKNPDEWRRGTSYRVTFSNNIIAEGLRYSTHSKGEHSKGSLIHDNASDILIVGNLYAHNHERNPLFKGGVRGMVISNLIYNPGPRAVHYNLIAEEWRNQTYQVGQMALVGNVLRTFDVCNDLECVARLRNALQSEHLDGSCRPGFGHRFTAVREHCPDLARELSDDQRIADLQRSLLHESGRDRTATFIQTCLEHNTRCTACRTRFQAKKVSL
jgi:hypothetical protein